MPSERLKTYTGSVTLKTSDVDVPLSMPPNMNMPTPEEMTAEEEEEYLTRHLQHLKNVIQIFINILFFVLSFLQNNFCT